MKWLEAIKPKPSLTWEQFFEPREGYNSVMLRVRYRGESTHISTPGQIGINGPAIQPRDQWEYEEVVVEVPIRPRYDRSLVRCESCGTKVDHSLRREDV